MSLKKILEKMPQEEAYDKALERIFRQHLFELQGALSGAGQNKEGKMKKAAVLIWALLMLLMQGACLYLIWKGGL